MFKIFSFLKSGSRTDNVPDLANNQIQEKVARDLDVKSAVLAHENWKLRLTAYLSDQSTENLRPEVICFDDRCDLGKWLHGDAKQCFGDHPRFQSLVGEHKNFHYHASNVVSLKMQGKKEKAELLLNSEFQKCSERVISMLNELGDETVVAQ
ncbi:CZB domain-containing protein [Solimicrobium silvestre]|uniref:MCP-signal associated domain n=1 Tax=Solimicrobium silvestre TaxID=2099400 RepID=A0A2S9GZ51_9BURK|nr:CZB domain-containing protein [Solimicrobium silvestre]PRC92906.1 MCP-signal associated domain [Solimicrobium silvestre]